MICHDPSSFVMIAQGFSPSPSHRPCIKALSGCLIKADQEVAPFRHVGKTVYAALADIPPA
ncbi:MAG: hypothetical protein INF65_02995 [Roseomonas sp.]|nr:hypothetical protein [Roseomonas sp.]MCA3409172.1 hypothetical protein [Roseomonas sp.]